MLQIISESIVPSGPSGGEQIFLAPGWFGTVTLSHGSDESSVADGDEAHAGLGFHGSEEESLVDSDVDENSLADADGVTKPGVDAGGRESSVIDPDENKTGHASSD